MMTWDDLMAYLAPRHEQLDLDTLLAWVETLKLKPGQFDACRHFAPEKYTRNLIWADERLEVLAMCWEPGQRTSIHNHGESFGIIYVLEGCLFSEAFHRLDRGETPGKARVEATRFEIARPGQVLVSQTGDIHRIGNAPGHADRSVSLHFYARPLNRIETFSESGEVAEVVFPYHAAPLSPPEAYAS